MDLMIPRQHSGYAVLVPTIGNASCADGIVVDKFTVTVACCADGEGCTGHCTNVDGCAGGGVVAMHGFRIAGVVFFEIGSSSSALTADSALIRSFFCWKLSLSLH